MPNDLEREFAIVPRVNELACRRLPERNSAEYKWPCMESEALGSVLPLLAHKMDRVQPLRPRLGDRERLKGGTDCNGQVRHGVSPRPVTEPAENGCEEPRKSSMSARLALSFFCVCIGPLRVRTPGTRPAQHEGYRLESVARRSEPRLDHGKPPK